MSPRIFGEICHATPYLLRSQPQCSGLRPARSAEIAMNGEPRSVKRHRELEKIDV